MIKKVTLDNFKAFKHAEIEIKPLTILVGPNSGGKSSLLNSISLIKQTLRANDSDVLKFKGIVNGDFESILHQGATSKEIRMKIEFEEDDKYFDVTFSKDSNTIDVKNFFCNTGEFEYTVQNMKTIKSAESKSYLPESYSFKFKGVEKFDEYLIKNVKPIFHRNNFFIVPSFSRDNFDLFSNYIRDIDNEIHGFTDSKVNILSLNDRTGLENKLRSIQMFLSVEKFSNDFNFNVRQEFGNISYLGPVRYTPDGLPLERGHFDDVGYKGENTVPIIAENGNIKNKVIKILKNLGIAKSVEIIEKDGKYLELKLKTEITNSLVGLENVGYGTSQILPIIVQSFLSKKNAMVIVEQPETHLHPKVQADFASFVFDLVKNSKTKFIIETHSEYFVERIRTCIMTNPALANDVIIYYVEQNKEEKQSKITSIKINSKGQYSYLPEGYLTNLRVKEIDTQMDIMYEKLKKK